MSRAGPPHDTVDGAPPALGMRSVAEPATGVTAGQRIWAYVVMAALVCTGIGLTPFANAKLLPIPGYMTAFGSVMIVINLLLAVLLFSKGSIEGRGDASRLGIAYFFVAAIFIPLVASFPNAIVPGSIIGTPISSVWLWSFWHAGFAFLVARYAWLTGGAKRMSVSPVLSIAIVILACAALTVVATTLLPYLPSTMADGHTLFSGLSGAIPAIVLMAIALALVLVCRLGAQTHEQLWLTVAMVAALFDVWLTYRGAERFSIGWYLSKLGSLFTSLAVLVTLLHDVTLLHARAASANALLRETAQHLERARALAENAARQQTEFVANMSHELRTPLTGILGIHDLLDADTTLKPGQRRYLDMARDAGRTLLAIVNDVLDFSKIDAGLLTIERVPFDLTALVEACRDLNANGAAKKALQIEARVIGSPVTLVGDPARLRQVLLNLMTNAVKFTQQGSVVVETRYDAEQARLRVEVTDTGIGIAEDKLPLMFERFCQADPSITRRYGGTGLGLAICKRLTGLMGGEIGVKSELGRGSTFWIELPLAAIAEPADKPPPISGGTACRWRVLLAEDNLVNQEIVAAMLEQRGHAVTLVDNGAAAVAEAAIAPGFDVILMDFQMPVMDGLTATRAIRAAERGEGRTPTPIIGLTANAMLDDVERCLAAGMEAHVAKPIDWADLFATMDRVAFAAAPEAGRPPVVLGYGPGEASRDQPSPVIGAERVTAVHGPHLLEIE